MRTKLSFAFFILWGLFACETEQIEYAVSKQVRLFDAIKAYKFSVDELRKLIDGGINQARKDLSNKKMKVISYQPIAFEWHSRLNNIDYEIENMERKLKKIDEEAKEYFEKLDTVTHHIKDPAIKASELKHNQKFKREWSELYKIGTNALKEIKRINLKGQDVHKVIINDGLRQENQNSLRALANIKKEYDATLAAMAKFSCESGRKISIKNADLTPVCGKKAK